MNVVMITGAARNTGYQIARKFASEGYGVAITSRSASDAAAAAQSLHDAYGVPVRGYALDLADVADIDRVFDRVCRDFGRLDTFIPNSAHLGVGGDMLSVTEERYHEVMDINLKGTFFCCRAAVRQMRTQATGGAIVLLSSVHSKECIWGRSLYTASKGALNALARSVAVEFGPDRIRANAIIAGAIRTERWDHLTEAQIAEKRKNWPIGRESTGADIANAAYYLGTPLSGTVTGTELTVDSGVLVSLLPFNGGVRS